MFVQVSKFGQINKAFDFSAMTEYKNEIKGKNVQKTNKKIKLGKVKDEMTK